MSFMLVHGSSSSFISIHVPSYLFITPHDCAYPFIFVLVRIIVRLLMFILRCTIISIHASVQSSLHEPHCMHLPPHPGGRSRAPQACAGHRKRVGRPARVAELGESALGQRAAHHAVGRPRRLAPARAQESPTEFVSAPLPLPLTSACGMRFKREFISRSKAVLGARPYFGIAPSIERRYSKIIFAIGMIAPPGADDDMLHCRRAGLRTQAGHDRACQVIQGLEALGAS